jgi:hypothetical protein
MDAMDNRAIPDPRSRFVRYGNEVVKLARSGPTAKLRADRDEVAELPTVFH